jgi:6-phosphofructokinase 1
VLATQYGAHAVRLVVEERFGEMVCYHPPRMDSVPIAQAVNHIREVDANGDAVQSARALGISFGDRPTDDRPFVSYEKMVHEIEARLENTESAVGEAMAASV